MLIITADDFGFSPSRNEAILAAALRGRLSAASLMVNMPYAEEACEQVRIQAPKLGIGLHFTLTSGSSLAPPEEVPLLVDKLGMFKQGFLSLRFRVGNREGKRNEALLRQIRVEFEAQVRRMSELQKKFALRVDHMDSHQHIHAIRPIWNILAEEARNQKLVLRMPREIPTGPFTGLLPSPVGRLKKGILDSCTRGIEQPVGYFGVVESGRMGPAAWKKILQIVDQQKDRVFEVNVHPGMLSGKEADAEAVLCSAADHRFHRDPWRHREFDTLLEPSFREDLKALGLFPLATFRDVAPSPASPAEPPRPDYDRAE